MNGRPYLVKLVRDRIGQFIDADGRVEYRPIDDPERVRTLLREKLIHEATEYLTNPCVDELADVLEAVKALALVDLGVEFARVESAARLKVIERGGMEWGMGMFVTTTHPTDGER